MAEDGLHLTLLDDGAVVQNGHAVADFLHNAHLVGDDNHRDAQLAVDFLNQLQNRVGGVGVQRTGGLIAKQHLRVGCQCAGNRNALLLATRQLRGVGIRLVGQTDQLQQFAGTGFGLVLGDLGQLHREHNVAQAGALHQQVKLLKNHRNLAAGSAQVSCIQALHLLAVHRHAALIRALQHIDTAYQRGFSRAGHTNNAVDIAVLYRQVDIIQRDDRAALRGKALGQVLQFDHGWFSLIYKDSE